MTRLARGRKIGLRRTWRRAGGWLLVFLVIVLIASAGRAPTHAVKTNPITPRPASGANDGPTALTQRGQRAVGLGFPAADPVAAAVRAGDRIDVTGAFAAAPDGQPLARTVLTKILVIGAVRQGANIALTLSLTPQEAETLAFAAGNARLSLALCPAGPDTGLPTEGVTFDDI